MPLVAGDVAPARAAIVDDAFSFFGVIQRFAASFSPTRSSLLPQCVVCGPTRLRLVAVPRAQNAALRPEPFPLHLHTGCEREESLLFSAQSRTTSTVRGRLCCKAAGRHPQTLLPAVPVDRPAGRPDPRSLRAVCCRRIRPPPVDEGHWAADRWLRGFLRRCALGTSSQATRLAAAVGPHDDRHFAASFDPVHVLPFRQEGV
jgi:hypothetical protein